VGGQAVATAAIDAAAETVSLDSAVSNAAMQRIVVTMGLGGDNTIL
jgi:hypothetical protein